MRLAERRIRERLEADGRMPFADFMETALYGDEGYYAGERAPIGRGGDFVTGSSHSPRFARSTATLLARLDRILGRPADYLECGYGNGEHLAGVAEAAATAGRTVVGCDRVARAVAGARTLQALPPAASQAIDGLVFSYELFDALPVHRLVGRADGSLGELWVELDPSGRFRWREGGLSRVDLGEATSLDPSDLEPGQIADLAPGWAPLYRRLARRLGRGLLVTCDYGYERARLLDPRVRRQGTLACYTRHTVHRDPFRAVGEQDLTAHVDWTALREAGESEGLETVALTRQALWLTACGVFDGLDEADLPDRLDAATLLDPEGMGSDIRVLIQSRGLDAAQVLPVELLG